MPQRASPSDRLAWHLAQQKNCGCRPIPSGLLDARPAGSPRADALRGLLAGGDRRSIAHSNVALAVVLGDRRLVAAVAALAEDGDALVSMRAIDLLEKVAQVHAGRVRPYRRLFLGPLADSARWEVRLQVVRALPLLTVTPEERRRAVEILRRDVRHPQTFVRAWALDSLATFASEDPALLSTVEACLREFARSPKKALVTRARLIRERLGGASPAGRRSAE